MAAKKRITKRQLKEDQFVSTAFHFAEYYQQNRAKVLIAAGGAIAILLVVTLMVRFRVSSARSSAALLGSGVGLYQNGRYDEASLRLANFLDAHSGSKDAAYAALLCGDSYYYLGRYDEAEEKYRLAMDKAEEGSDLSLSASAGTAAVDEAKAKPLAAAETYASLAERYEDPIEKTHMLYSAIRCYRQGNDFMKAAELIARLDEKNLDPIDAASFQWHKREVEIATGNASQAR